MLIDFSMMGKFAIVVLVTSLCCFWFFAGKHLSVFVSWECKFCSSGLGIRPEFRCEERRLAEQEHGRLNVF